MKVSVLVVRLLQATASELAATIISDTE